MAERLPPCSRLRTLKGKEAQVHPNGATLDLCGKSGISGRMGSRFKGRKAPLTLVKMIYVYGTADEGGGSSSSVKGENPRPSQS